MSINIILFGQLTDITGTGRVVLEDVADTDSMVDTLHKSYPAFLHSKYVIAVNKKIISENTALSNDSTVALLPPFSGG